MNSSSPNASPFARPPRPEQQQNPENRGSLLRASILESALELGVGSSRTVANWIFNPVDEVEEEEENQGVISPSLTYASTATSEESNLSAGLAQRSQPGAGILLNGKELPLSLDTSVQYSQRNGLSPGGITPDRSLQFDLRTTPEPRAISPLPPAPSPQPSLSLKNKLRKARPDGYESDGGYMSEGGKGKKEKKEKKSKKKGKDKDKDGAGEGGATDYESDGAYLSEASVKKKKSKKEKKDKSKSKSTDSPATDYETDKGYSSSFSRSRSKKQSVTSPVSGDESDRGYLSESTKKRRFFRLNSKSRKKQDSLDSAHEQPPPVPALPTLPLPIHEMFSRANTPVVDSRNATPIPGEPSISVRPSVETFSTMDTSTSMDTTLTADTTSTTLGSDERLDSDESLEGLTRAFQDAESVRSPSIDFLSTFRRPNRSLSPSKLNPFSHGDRAESPVSPRSPVAALSPSRSIRSRPQISAPNTTTLNLSATTKHVPVPLTLTPPTPTASTHAGRIPPSPDPDYVLVTPNPSTPASADEGQGHHSTPSAGSSGGPPSPTVPRPHVLAYYDLPPPSPPPRGPLPDVPSDISRSTSPSWSMMESSLASPSRFPRSAPADTADPRGLQQRPLASPMDRDRPNTAAPHHPSRESHPLSREISRDVPTIAQPIPPAQRGRMSPFPTAPVLPREQTGPLVRQTSRLTQEAVSRALRNGSAPASASPYPAGHSRWPSNEPVGVASGPASAQPYPARDSRWPTREKLNVQWQPRSASALSNRRPISADIDVEGTSDDGHSFLVYDEDGQPGDISDQSLSAPHTRPGSTEPPEPSPDVNAILAGFRAQRDAELAVRQGRKPDRDTLAGIVAGYERDTMYLDVDEGGGDRSSVWSEANSRYSFLDGEKSAAIRDKFVKRVEAMYGRDLVPPVPRLDPGVSSRSG
ncbi:hypothetical protein L226DRAFT_536804 [Lentinus tigrinus ALCF2SS1-7]|uniref:Uncharacterized protein n=1 Tax=Lentinus tigrinus ALCF2SS1-6 TaxID=1328759 RepID=A0A5C2S3N0_9APHY|nr:hypothetical protein L227DRAFT_602054 [Lentinus tigrinus ALCF2SS1-6]RPD72967.1 hypothetical protein L226DRAFT_536804 [Lentinus tigrinus ALCF2SS1-7]